MDFLHSTASGIEKTTEKDVCEYHIHLTRPSADRAREVLDIAQSIAAPWTAGYIWQDQPFALNIDRDFSISGSTRFGDCIEDEWFIVWILHELSLRCPDTLLRITDTDGDFLLIESAMHLPRWLDPETASHRTWMRRGELIVLEPSAVEMSRKEYPDLSLADALDQLRRDRGVPFTKAVQGDAFARISGYPSQSRTEGHRVRCRLPRRIASVIHAHPYLISPICIEFYTRDPLQSSQFEVSGISWSSKEEISDQVTVSVKFTRTLYAQIKGSRYRVPAWYPQLSPDSPTSEEARETGSKVAFGFSMLRESGDQNLLNALESTAVASDEEISLWDQEVDSDGYLDVNFEELEAAMAGTYGEPRGEKEGEEEVSVKKMMDQLSSFMNADSTFEGAGFSDEDEDDEDDDDDDGEDAEDEDGDSEDDGFMQFLRTSVTDPSSIHQFLTTPTSTKSTATPSTKSVPRSDPMHSSKQSSKPGATQFENQEEQGEEEEEEDEEEESVGDLEEYMAQLDSELSSRGVSTLPTSSTTAAPKTLKPLNDDDRGGEEENGDLQFVDEDEDGEEGLNIDYHVAKNMLASMSGSSESPMSILFSRLGVTIPRNNDDDDDE